MCGRKLKNSIGIIERYADENTVLSFSGGKDSLVVLDLALKTNIDKIVFSNTTVEFDETIEYINTVEEFYGIKIDTLEPPKEFFELVNELGFPSRRLRWCCKVIKFGPLGEYAIKNNVSAYITGMRRDESTKRKSYDYLSSNPLIPVKQINPILDWTNKEIWEYIKENELPVNPLYKSGFNRVGCWVCPYKTKSGWEQTKEHSPELVDYLEGKLTKVISDYRAMGIKDTNDFVKNFGWTSYAYPQTSKIGGYIKKFHDRLILYLKDKEDIERIKQILPIVSDKYERINDTLVITDNDQKALRILAEKALNCIGCGACISTCDNGALEIIDGKISVKKEICVKCKKCLKTNGLRGACIGRNYALRRKEIQIVKSDAIDIKSNIGIIRTRKSLDKLADKLKDIGVFSKSENRITISNGKFTAYIQKNSAFMEIKIFSREGDLQNSMMKIREKIYA